MRSLMRESTKDSPLATHPMSPYPSATEALFTQISPVTPSAASTSSPFASSAMRTSMPQERGNWRLQLT
eukprot:848822-Rhodomonas_salina.1